MTDVNFVDGDFQEEQRQLQLQQQNMTQQQLQQQQNIDNPFNNALQKYGVNNLPDTPINFGGGMADTLLNDNEVPEKFRKNYWWWMHKDNVLTFLDVPRKQSKLMNFDITRIDMINTMPYYDYDFDLEMKFGILRNLFETKLDRALGIQTSNIKNERITLQSQFSENRQIQEMGSGMGKEGFFRRLLGRK
jgi:hypothetical protein